MIKIFENDDFVVDYDTDTGRYRVSYFEDHHFKEECWFDEYEEKITIDSKPLVFPDDIEEIMKEAERVIMTPLYLL